MSLSNVNQRLNDLRSRTSSSPLSNALGDAKNGVASSKSATTGLVNQAGTTFKSTTSLLGDVKQTLFGGSSDAVSNPVKANGSGSGQSGNGVNARASAFFTKPTETLPSLDPLTRDVSKPFEAASQAANDAMDYLDPTAIGAKLGKGFSSIKDMADEALQTAESWGSRLESSLDTIGNIMSLPNQVLDRVAATVQQYEQMENGYKAVVDGYARTFKSLKDLTDLQNITSFMKNYFAADRDAGVMDMAATKALILSMGASVITIGMPEKIEELIATIKDPNERAEIYDELIKTAAKLGSLRVVEYYQPKLTAGHAQIVADTVIKDLLANISTEPNDSLKDFGVRMLAVFELLKPQWDVKAGRKSLDLYIGANTTAIQILITTDRRPMAVAGGSVKSLKAAALVEAFFPIK